MAKKKKTDIEISAANNSEVVTNCDHLVPVAQYSNLNQQDIEALIYVVRDTQVMLDRDLAMIYGVETKVLNQAVKRNINRFPADFMFQLTEDENDSLRSQIVTSNNSDESLRSQIVTSNKRGGIRYLPYAFT